MTTSVGGDGSTGRNGTGPVSIHPPASRQAFPSPTLYPNPPTQRTLPKRQSGSLVFVKHLLRLKSLKVILSQLCSDPGRETSLFSTFGRANCEMNRPGSQLTCLSSCFPPAPGCLHVPRVCQNPVPWHFLRLLTHRHKEGGLKQHTCVTSQFCRSESGDTDNILSPEQEAGGNEDLDLQELEEIRGQ